MEKRSTDAKRDILAEDYKGTGAVVSGLGYSVIETKIMLIVGALFGGAVGAIIPDHVNKWSSHWQQQGQNAVHNNPKGSGVISAVKRGYGHTINKIFEWSEKLADHMPGKELAEAHMGGAGGTRMKAVISAAGITSIVAIMVSLVHSFFAGAQSASSGKNQFERAKNDIRTLRDEKDALTTELEKTSKELAKTKAEVTKFAAENDVTPKTIISNAEYAHTIEQKQHHHRGHHA